MFNHQPENYDCPFCRMVAGEEDEYANQQDIVYQNEYVTAAIAPKWWVHNPANVLIVPNQHYENLYDTPDEIVAEVYKTAKQIAVAIRSTYEGCSGTSTRQHNEPDGNQAVWHLHVHVFPRYKDDELYQQHDNKRFVGAEERLPYAERIRSFFATGK